jgi:hypothetical protein
MVHGKNITVFLPDGIHNIEYLVIIDNLIGQIKNKICMAFMVCHLGCHPYTMHHF